MRRTIETLEPRTLRGAATRSTTSSRDTGRKTNVKHVIEPLERRTLLSTYVINGGAGNDHWFIDCSPGVVRFNGTQINNPAITDVQINGFDGRDSVVIQSAGIPVVFNGGNHDDWISLTSGNLTPITSTLTFNGAGGYDYVEVRDTLYGPNTTYSVNSNNVFERATGHGRTLMDAGTESLRIEGGSGSNAYYINNVMPTLGISITGGATGEQFHVDMVTARNVSIDGGGGNDYLSISDYNRATGGSYYVGGAVVQQGGSGGEACGFTNVERLVLQGSGNGPSWFHVNDVHPNMEVDVLGWSFNDTFAVDAAHGEFNLGQGLNIAGFGGNDVISYNARWLGYVTMFNVNPGSIAANAPRSQMEFQDVEDVRLGASDFNNEFFVTGTAADVTVQTSIYAGNGNNTVWVYAHDAQGNLPLKTNLGVIGEGGTDNMIVYDINSTLPINYRFFNPFGAGTCDIAGLGTGLLGAASDVESVQVIAGNADDTFTIDSFQSGNALTISAGGGDDTVDFVPNSRRLDSNVTSISAFNYSGGAGNDVMRIYNDNSPAPWNYSRTNSYLFAQQGGYFVYLNNAGVERVAVSSGMVGDQFNIISVPPGTALELEGGGGDDNYTLSQNGSTQNIRGAVSISGAGGGNDTILVADNGDTVGRTFHITADGFVGATAGDDLFGPGGSLQFTQITGLLRVRCGSGNDTAYVAPHPITPITVELGAQPAGPEGGGDFAGFAFADATNPVFTPGEPGAGSYTFADRAPVSYTGAEDAVVDDIAPTVETSSFEVDLAAQAIRMQFSEDVSGTLVSGSITLTNTTTNETVAADLAYDTATNTAMFTFPSYPYGALPDGDYHLALPAGAVTDLFGNALIAEHTLDFFFMQGDANRDRRVNLQDFNILATNFGQSNRTFSQADFNYDGTVNLSDFNILAARFGNVLAAAAGAAPAASGRATDVRKLAAMLDDVLA